MRLISITLQLVGLAVAAVDFENWHPAVPGDSRCACPALNSLANHGILPHNGKNLTVPVVTKALNDAFNLSMELSTGLSSAGLKTASIPASGIFNLEDVNKHNIIEHDASLSRKDFSVDGDNHSFDETIFCEFLGYFGNITNITIPAAAAARWGRVQTEQQRDRNFTYTVTNRFNSYAESAVYFRVLNDPVTGSTPLDFVRIFFEQERLPYKEGWRTSRTSIDGFVLAGDILGLALSTPEKFTFTTSEAANALHMGGRSL